VEPGIQLLDIGCGWGSLARFAADRYGVQVVGKTISQAQAELAAERCQGLPVEIRLQENRDRDETIPPSQPHTPHRRRRWTMEGHFLCMCYRHYLKGELDGFPMLRPIQFNDGSYR